MLFDETDPPRKCPSPLPPSCNIKVNWRSHHPPVTLALRILLLTPIFLLKFISLLQLRHIVHILIFYPLKLICILTWKANPTSFSRLPVAHLHRYFSVRGWSALSASYELPFHALNCHNSFMPYYYLIFVVRLQMITPLSTQYKWATSTPHGQTRQIWILSTQYLSRHLMKRTFQPKTYRDLDPHSYPAWIKYDNRHRIDD